MSETLVVGAKFKTSAVALVAVGKPTYGEWEVSLSVVAGISRSCQWWLGDLLNLGHSKFGEKYSQAVDELGYDPAYLRNLAYVCGRVQMSLRSDNLTFSHHTLVAALNPEEQKKWITLAVNNKWTVKQMKEAMQQEDGEDQGDVEEGEGDDELSNLVHEIEDYLDQLDDNRSRAAAIRVMLRSLKGMAQKYREE